MKRTWKIVTNGEWYELEYTYWWLPFWFRYEPHQYERHGYQPIDESQFKFSSISEARDKIKELKREKNEEQWYDVVDGAKDGRIREGKEHKGGINDLPSQPAPMPPVSEPLTEGRTKSNKKENPKGRTEGPKPPSPQGIGSGMWTSETKIYYPPPPKQSKLIYLAIPYSHDDESVRQYRLDTVSRIAAEYMNNGHVVFSPVSHGVEIAKVNDLPTDWEYWQKSCETFLEKSTKLVVIMVEGWEYSEGVYREILCAKKNNIEIEYRKIV